MADNKSKGALSGVASGAASGAMVAGPWGALIGGVIGGVSGLLSGGAADEAEKLAELQAKFKGMETDENLRRMKLKEDYKLGYTKSAIAASNLQMTGSSKRHYNQLSTQLAADRAWLRESSRIEQRMITKGGQAASSGIMTSMYAGQIRQAGSALSGAFSSFGGGEMDQAGIDMGFDQPQFEF